MSNLLRSLVAFHRGQPFWAATTIVVSCVLIMLASGWAHGLLERGQSRPTPQLAMLVFGLFALSVVLAVVTVVRLLPRNYSQALPYTILWSAVSMMLLGVSHDVESVLFAMAIILLTVLSIISYVTTVGQLWGKHTMVCAEKAKAALSGREVRLPPVHRTSDVLAARK